MRHRQDIHILDLLTAGQKLIVKLMQKYFRYFKKLTVSFNYLTTPMGLGSLLLSAKKNKNLFIFDNFFMYPIFFRVVGGRG